MSVTPGRALLVALLLFPGLAQAAGDLQVPKGFTALFNGKDLTGWHGMPHFNPYALDKMSEADRKKQIDAWTADAKKHWTVKDAELINDGHGAYLTTDKEYGDIELLIEYRTVPKADSGIYLRATPQVQIWDYTKEGGKWNLGADKGSGGLWNNSPGAPGKDPLVLADKPFGEWNSFRILQVGERTTVYLNGKLVVDHARLENFWKRGEPLRRTGPIQLQTHGGEIRWRNVFIREIPPEEANRILRKHSSSGFKDVFNGKDLTGWAGPINSYEVKDGAIVCKPGKGGNLYTKEEFADFVARVEYRLPPDGNNGLAIRYPGKGQPSSVAMCEVQILDDTAEKYKKLDPRQYNGSAYGMVPAHRGHLRQVGEWNFMEVTARGSKLQVELNGVRILDTDLSKVTKFMGDKEHPGKDRTSGHFGFCGHSDPVAFRLVQIKPLQAARSADPEPSRDKVRVILIDGQNNHDWRATTPVLKKILEDSGRFTVDVSSNLKKGDKPGRIEKTVPFPPDLSKYDVLLSNYNGAPWPKDFEKSLSERLKEGRIGLVIVHAANNSFGGWKEYNLMIGMGWRGKDFGERLKLEDGKEVRVPKGEDLGSGHRYAGKFPIVVRNAEHPVTKGMPREWMHNNDELYDNLRGPIQNVKVLATAYSKGTKAHEPMIWTVDYGKGRVFHTPMGHDVNSMKCVGFAVTVSRGTEWAATGKVSLPIPKDFPTEKEVRLIK